MGHDPAAASVRASLHATGGGSRRTPQVDHEASAAKVFELARTGMLIIRQITNAFRKRAGHFLLVFTVKYESIDLALVEVRATPAGSNRQPSARPWLITIERRTVSRLALRVLRRVTFTEEDGYDQHDKMLAAFQSSEWSCDWFHNRGLFSDQFLESLIRGKRSRGTNTSIVPATAG